MSDIKHFYDYACDALEIPEDDRPKVSYESMGDTPSFGGYMPSTKSISLRVRNRHFMDIARSLAHELVHHKQHITVGLKPGDGETGTDVENEANAVAGVIMRSYGRKYPEHFATEKVMVNETFYQKIARKLKKKTLDEEFTDSMGNEYVELGLTVRDKDEKNKVTQGTGVGPVSQA